MDYLVYKVIHLIGVCTLFFSLGSLFTKYNKGAVIGHGVALLLLLVSGFGIHAKLGAGQFPTWMLVKIAIWLVFATTVTLAKRGIITAKVAWIGLIALGGVAAYLGVYKPF